MITKPCTQMVVHSCSVVIGRTQYDARLNVEHTISQSLSSKLCKQSFKGRQAQTQSLTKKQKVRKQ